MEINHSPEQVWENLLGELKETINRPTFETLLSTAKPLSYQNAVLEVTVPNTFSREWLIERCQKDLEEKLRQFTGVGEAFVKFTVVPTEPQAEAPLVAAPPSAEAKREALPAPAQPVGNLLNPRYTFEMFVIGQGNRFAHAGSLAVSESPAKAYNPLFLYGGVGLGKTHLMQAIGNKIYQNKPSTRIMYVTSEQFTNDLINSIRYDRMEEFRNRYRNIDVLLVDDVQFIGGKERTEEEFFHTFNALHEASKQIVVSSDRPPKEIPTLEERLRSRFEWGLIADIQPPDLETRIAILRKKAESGELEVPDEILHVIASKVSSNIRELEGALIRVVAYTSLEGCPLTTEMVEKVIKESKEPKREKPITPHLIKKTVADFYSVRIDDMSAKIRTKEIAGARQVAMYLCRELTSASLPKIGEEFGGRDHTTVMYACDKVKELLEQDKEVYQMVQTITEKLKNMTIVEN